MKRWTVEEPARILPTIFALIVIYALTAIAAAQSFAEMLALPRS